MCIKYVRSQAWPASQRQAWRVNNQPNVLPVSSSLKKNIRVYNWPRKIWGKMPNSPHVATFKLVLFLCFKMLDGLNQKRDCLWFTFCAVFWNWQSLPSLYLSLIWFNVRIIMKKSGKMRNYLIICHLRWKQNKVFFSCKP